MTTEKVVVNVYTDAERAMQASANAKMKLAETVNIPYEEYVEFFSDENNAEFNPGGRKVGDEIALVESLRNGMHTKPVICITDLREIGARGYLRKMAIAIIKTDYPADFEKRYADGIDCLIVNGATEKEAYFLACDHSMQKARSRMAVIDQGIAMVKRNCIEYQICIELHNEMEQIFNPLSPKRLELIANAISVKDKLTEVFKARKGVIQTIKRLANLPICVYDAYRNTVEGLEGDKIKMSDISDLHNANATGSQNDPAGEFLVMFDSKVKAFGTPNTEPKGPLSKANADALLNRCASTTAKAFYYVLMRRLPVDLTELDKLLKSLEDNGTIVADVFAEVNAAIQKDQDAKEAAVQAAKDKEAEKAAKKVEEAKVALAKAEKAA